jgi:hypothetical protein
MGIQTVSEQVTSKVVESDDEFTSDSVHELLGNAGIDSIVLASMGTSPSVTNRGGRLTVVSGTGTPAIAVNNIQITCKRPPRAVFLRAREVAAGFYVASISGNVVNIGTKVAPVVSTTYPIDVLILY